jgi:hypothetical protein
MLKHLLIPLLFIFNSVSAQKPDSSIFSLPVQMDETVVKAMRGGWDVNGFIRRVKSDTTFYKAFRSLHLVSYSATNDIKVLDSKGKTKASLHSKTRQNVSKGCRTMQVLEEKTTGDFYKRKKEYRYYTAELYASLFFTEGKICGENDIVAGALKLQGKSQLEKNKYRLKLLMFAPGSKISGVPFMGDKAAIFEPDVVKMYDFKLISDEYGDEDCYVFKAIPKKKYLNDLVYDEFTTWFRKSDYAIVARDYSLSYSTMLYDFKVKMKVRTTQSQGKLLPSHIEYDGNWHIFSKGRERVRFVTDIHPE